MFFCTAQVRPAPRPPLPPKRSAPSATKRVEEVIRVSDRSAIAEATPSSGPQPTRVIALRAEQLGVYSGLLLAFIYGLGFVAAQAPYALSYGPFVFSPQI